jgi:uncharacterized protein
VKHHPVVRGGYPLRILSLLLGLLLFALGIVFILESRLGLSPWDVLNQGIAKHTPLSFGMANVAVGLCVLLVAWALGGRPGIGTVANAVLVGTFIQVLTSVDALTSLADEPVAVRAVLLLGGIAIVGLGSAFYIAADFGAGPRDTLMLVGSRRTGRRIGLVRGVLELSALAAGIALGGTFGIGTVVFALAIGPVIEIAFRLLELTPLAARVPTPAAVVEGL